MQAANLSSASCPILPTSILFPKPPTWQVADYIATFILTSWLCCLSSPSTELTLLLSLLSLYCFCMPELKKASVWAQFCKISLVMRFEVYYLSVQQKIHGIFKIFLKTGSPRFTYSTFDASCHGDVKHIPHPFTVRPVASWRSCQYPLPLVV